MNMDYYQISAEELGQNAKVPLLKLGDSGEVFYELALEMIGEIEKNNAVGSSHGVHLPGWAGGAVSDFRAAGERAQTEPEKLLVHQHGRVSDGRRGMD